MNVVIRIFFVFICFTFHIGNGLAATKQNALEELPLCKSEWCFVLGMQCICCEAMENGSRYSCSRS